MVRMAWTLSQDNVEEAIPRPTRTPYGDSTSRMAGMSFDSPNLKALGAMVSPLDACVRCDWKKRSTDIHSTTRPVACWSARRYHTHIGQSWIQRMKSPNQSNRRIPWESRFCVFHPSGIDPQTTRDQTLLRLESMDGAAVAPRHGQSAPAHRPRCPRCQTHGPQRWGSFSGRQRWRCRGCKRTFSTFTGSLLFRIRKLEAWHQFVHHLWTDQSLREAAKTAGINKDTAHKWRLRLLDALRHPPTEAGLPLPYALAGPHEDADLPSSPRQLFLLPVMGRATLTKRTLGTLPQHRNIIAAMALRISGPTIRWDFAEVIQRQPRPNTDPRANLTFAISPGAHRYLRDHAPTLLSPIGRTIELRATGQPHRAPRFTEATDPPFGTPLAARAHDARQICRRTGWLFRRWLARFHGISPHHAQRYLDWFMRTVFPTLQGPLWPDRTEGPSPSASSRMLRHPGFPITR